MNIYQCAKRHTWCVVGIIYSVIGIIFSLFLTLLALASAPPLALLTIAVLVLCIVGICKLPKKDKIFKSTIKEWRKKYRKGSSNISGETTYCFISPMNYESTMNMLQKVLGNIGKIKSVDSVHGRIITRLDTDNPNAINVDYYIERSDVKCKVRAVFHKIANDDWWDLVIAALIGNLVAEKSPITSIEVTAANGHPHIASVLYLGGDTHQVHNFTTKNSPSLGGFLVGGILFGEAGAVVGGLSGKSRTRGTSITQFSNSQLVRLIYNNGRLWEGEVKKNSPMYQEIMVNA